MSPAVVVVAQVTVRPFVRCEGDIMRVYKPVLHIISSPALALGTIACSAQFPFVDIISHFSVVALVLL